jgi:hypothetical protein
MALRVHPYLDPPVDLGLIGPEQGHPDQCPGVVLGLEQSGHQLAFVTADLGSVGLQVDEAAEVTGQGVAVELAPPTLPSFLADAEQFLPLGPGHVVEIEQLLQFGSLEATAAVLDPADLAGVAVERCGGLLLELPGGLTLTPQRRSELQPLHCRPLVAHPVPP